MAPSRISTRKGRRAATFLALLFATACRDAIVALGGSGPAPAARTRAELAFWTLNVREIDPTRDARYEAARLKIAHAALLPSRVWDDTSIWTGTGPTRRELLLAGRFTGDHYSIAVLRNPPWPSHPADSRHVIDLTKLSDDEYAWDTEVGYAIGDVSAAGVTAFLRELFSAAEGREESDVRADYRAAAPRMSAALGMLFTVDSIKTAHLPDSSTLATFFVSMSTDSMIAKYPRFSEYLQRYIETAKMRWSLSDRSGAHYFDASLQDGRLMMRVRTRRGGMIAIAGATRPMPDSLTLTGDVTVKVKMFTVGVKRYRSEFTFARDTHETGFSVVSKQEPEWVLPLITERVLRTPLRRPFKGGGAVFTMAVRDSAGAQTMLVRRLHLEVQESPILRFIGRLSSTAVSDFTGKAELEEEAWWRAVFGGLVADTHALPF